MLVIATYDDLVNFIATNKLFCKVNLVDNDDYSCNFAMDLVLADEKLFAIASEEVGSDCADVVFEALKDDVYTHENFTVKR